MEIFVGQDIREENNRKKMEYKNKRKNNTKTKMENKKELSDGVVEINESLTTFNQNIKQRIREFAEADNQEIVLLRDLSRGIEVELHSRKISADKLLFNAQEGFKFLESRRLKS